MGVLCSLLATVLIPYVYEFGAAIGCNMDVYFHWDA